MFRKLSPSMIKTLALFLFLGAASLLAGCAVIDFLDGKHFDHSADNDRYQYSGRSNSGGSGSGGHFH